MYKTLFSILISLAVNPAYNQTVVKATSQGWAGGMCCASGTNYAVTLLLDTEPKDFRVEGIYLQGSGKMGATNVIHTISMENKIIYSIHFGNVFNNNEYPEMTKEKIEVIEQRKFDGKALIELNINGKSINVIVEEFEMLEFLAYP